MNMMAPLMGSVSFDASGAGAAGAAAASPYLAIPAAAAMAVAYGTSPTVRKKVNGFFSNMGQGIGNNLGFLSGLQKDGIPQLKSQAQISDQSQPNMPPMYRPPNPVPAYNLNQPMPWQNIPNRGMQQW